MRELGLQKWQTICLRSQAANRGTFQHWEMGNPRLGMKLMLPESQGTGTPWTSRMWESIRDRVRKNPWTMGARKHRVSGWSPDFLRIWDTPLSQKKLYTETGKKSNKFMDRWLRTGDAIYSISSCILSLNVFPPMTTRGSPNWKKQTRKNTKTKTKNRSGSLWGVVKNERKWSHSVVSDSLGPHRLSPTRLLCPWDFPGKSTQVGCHFLHQGIFLTQGSIPGLLHPRQRLYSLSH